MNSQILCSLIYIILGSLAMYANSTKPKAGPRVLKVNIKCARCQKQSNRRLTTPKLKRLSVAKEVDRRVETRRVTSLEEYPMLAVSILNYIYSCAFRRKPLNKHILAAKQIPIDYLVKKNVISLPTDFNYFIPQVHNDRAKMYFSRLNSPNSSSGHMVNSLNLLSVNWRELNSAGRGDVFERMHMSWLLAMRSHQASLSFLPEDQEEYDLFTNAKSQLLSHPNRQTRVRLSQILDTVPKGNLRLTHNNFKPLCNSTQSDEPFLLNRKYIIAKMPEDCEISKVGLAGLSKSALEELLLGNIALKNYESGPGYDYVIVDWMPDGTLGFKLVFTFIEMRFSSNASTLQQTMTEVEKKYSMVHREFESLKGSLPKVNGVKYDFRLVMECFRDVEENFEAEKLPDRVFLYDRVALGSAYGPSLTRNMNLTSFDE